MPAGGRVGVAGESGSGKTTLLRALAGLLSDAQIEGSYAVEGRVGYIPQEGLNSLSPFLTAGAQVAELTHSRDSRAAAARLLARAGLGDQRFYDAYPHQLSGGERQRVLVAQALAVRPAIILADEPTANLDPANEAIVLGMLDEYARETGAALLIASHREGVFQTLGCRVHRLTPAGAAAAPLAPGRPGAPLVTVRNLTKTYVTRDWLLRTRPSEHALDAVSIEISTGEFVAIAGPSGAGKSTLARCLAGRESIDAGSIKWHVALPQHRKVQLVQQEPSDSLNPRLTIAQALEEAGLGDRAELLPRVGLPTDWMSRKASELSEGQRARVAILRCAERLRGGLLILDESLAGLDQATRSQILSYLASARDEQGLAVLFVTHDPAVIAETGARAVRLEAGRVAV